jgi:hypothetical protein
MLAFEMIAERRIAEAAAQGEFDGLPGAGRPLDLDEDPLVPEEMRMASRILRNAGFRPGEAPAGGPAERRLALMNARVDARYFGRAVRKLGRR